MKRRKTPRPTTSTPTILYRAARFKIRFQRMEPPQNINAEPARQTYAVKSHLLLVSLISIMLVVTPAPITHQSTSPSPVPNQSNGRAILVTGQARLVGTVTVSSLPETSSSNPGQSAMPIMYSQGAQAFAQAKNETEQPGYVPPGESTKTITSASDSPQTLSTTVNLVLPGAPGTSPNPCGCTPPDPNNAVGPNHVFEMVNLAGIIYLKNGTLAKSTFPLSSFFSLSGSMSDPQILYDGISGRWFASIVDITNGNVQVAVSSNSDPTGTWNLYSFSAGGYLPDQPYIGTSDDKFGIAANDFFGNTFVGVEYWIANKSELVAGASIIEFSTNTPDSSMHTLRPVRHLTTTSEFYLVTNCIGSCVTDPMSTTSTVKLLTVSGLPPGSVAVSTQTFSVSTGVQPPNGLQPGCSIRTCPLVTNDNAILSAVWESGTLWLAWADSCIPSGDTTNRSCVHLVEATVAGTGSASKNQDFEFASKGEFLFYPAVSLYHGQLAVVYGKSSASLFPSLFVTGRQSTDPANTLESPVTIKTGTADDLSGRYGDYFGAGTDPLPTDNSTFWVSGEYRASSTNSAWSTEISQVGSFAPDFTIAAKPSNITLVVGGTGNSTMTLTSYKFVGSVNLSSAATPAGLSCILNPSVVSLGASATTTLSCSGLEGKYNVTVTGSSGTLSRSVSIGATVKLSTSVGGSLTTTNLRELLLPYTEGGLSFSLVVLFGMIAKNRTKTKRS